MGANDFSGFHTGEPGLRDRLVGYAPGVFDLFHVGHLNLLRRAREECDFLIAGVVSDPLAEGRKKSPPAVPLDERLAIVGAIRYVDAAVVEDRDSKIEMWHQLRFNRIVKGDDWEGTGKGKALVEMFEPFGVDVVYVPYTTQTSSTRLRAMIDRCAANERAGQ